MQNSVNCWLAQFIVWYELNVLRQASALRLNQHWASKKLCGVCRRGLIIRCKLTVTDWEVDEFTFWNNTINRFMRIISITELGLKYDVAYFAQSVAKPKTCITIDRVLSRSSLASNCKHFMDNKIATFSTKNSIVPLAVSFASRRLLLLLSRDVSMGWLFVVMATYQRTKRPSDWNK